MALALLSSAAAILAPYGAYRAPPARPAVCAARHAPLRLLEPPFELPYEVPRQPKPFSDYEWDPSYPGTFKPGLTRENKNLDEVLAAWEGKENPAALQMPRDQLWQVPLAPPEDILSWLGRVGLLKDDDADDNEEENLGGGDSLLDDEFDLDEELTTDGATEEDSNVDAM